MNKSSKLTEEDIAVFREAVRDVEPLKHDHVIIEKPRPKARPARTREDNQAVMVELLDSEFDTALVETGDELLYSHPGLQKRTLKKLRRGQIPVEAELDMHGMTVDVARKALSEFLGRCKARSKRCIRIVHGKGLGSKDKKPVLKNKLNNWLLKTDSVLAFCSATPMDGGTGAVYVLLKKN